MDWRELLVPERVEDAFALVRYSYRIGMPLLADDVYEQLEDLVKEINPNCPMLSRTYDDDDIPYDLVRKYLGAEHIVKVGDKAEYVDILDEEKSLSIMPHENYRVTWNWFNNNRGVDLHFSAKVDGVNSKNAWTPNETNPLEYLFRVSLSRGRKTNSISFTKTMCKIVPLKIVPQYSMPNIRVWGEVYATSEVMDRLKEKYTNGRISFASSKSTAISLLRTEYPEEFYDGLKLLAFDCDCPAETVHETYQYLEQYGFETPPNMLIKAEEVPDNFEDFKPWLYEKMTYIWEESQKRGIPTDGMVVNIDNKRATSSINNQYSSRNIAVKIEYWSYKYYVGTVKDIVLEPKRIKYSCRVEIEPLKTEDGSVARYVNTFNPSILFDNDIKIGSKVYFERKSQTQSNLLYGERLKEILSDG